MIVSISMLSDLQREELDLAHFLRQTRLDEEQEESLMEAQQASPW